MEHRQRPTEAFNIVRVGALPLCFEGWKVVGIWDGNGSGGLTLYETVGGHWVTQWIGVSRYVGVYEALDDAMEVIGSHPLAIRMRRHMGYPIVEYLA